MRLDGGQETDSGSFHWQGGFDRNRRFDAHRVSTIHKEAESFAFDEHRTFDGRLLTSGFATSEANNLWTTNSSQFELVLSMGSAEIEEIANWIDDPFQIPAFAQVDLQQTISGDRILVQRVYDGQWIGWELETEASDPTRPTRITIFDVLQRPRIERRFSSNSEVLPGVMRPLTVAVDIYPTGNPAQQTVRSTWTFARFMQSDELQAAMPTPGTWNVWQ